MATDVCARCGQTNPPEVEYCTACGTTLAEPGSGESAASQPPTGETGSTSTPAGTETNEASPEEHGIAAQAAQEAAALLPGAALLVVTRGPDVGSRFVLQEDITEAGSQPNAGIFLDHPSVSRRHAEFHRHDDTFAVRDVGSLNGTYVNGERVPEVSLSGGDDVQIGTFRLVFLTPDPPQTQVP